MSVMPCNIQGYHFTLISLRYNCGSAAVRLPRLLTNQLRTSTFPHMSFPNACPQQQLVIVDWAIKQNETEGNRNRKKQIDGTERKKSTSAHFGLYCTLIKALSTGTLRLCSATSTY